MIPRYTRPIMEKLWSQETRYQKWLEVEIAACEALSREGHIPAKDLAAIKKKARFSVERIEELEQITKHDVIAFLTNVAEHVGPASRHIHLGLTSSDVLDTSMAVLLKEAADILLDDLKALQEAIREQAFRHKKTVMIGRSHGIHAEPITFGLKLAIWYDEGQAKPAPPGAGPGNHCRGEDFRGRGDLRPYLPPGGGLCLPKTGAETRSGLQPDRAAGPPCRVFLHPGYPGRLH